MALVNVNYGANVACTVTVKNAGQAKGTFRLTGEILLPDGTVGGHFWDKLVRGDPLKAGDLIRAAGAVDHIDVTLEPGQSAQITMYTAPLYADPGKTANYAVRWRLLCLETNQYAEKLDTYAIQVTAPTPPMPQIVDRSYAVA